MNKPIGKKTGALLGLTLAFAGASSVAAEVPWKFEGDTNRVPASACLSAEACADFCAYDVAAAMSATPCADLVRWIWTSSTSNAADVPVYVGALLFIR